MKLEPIAKPIKIRIKIGDNEYSDLESVKRDFSIKDLFPLFKDGRLERWLKQIGENELAQKVGELSNQCRDKCEHDDGHAHIQFLSLFFDDVEKSLSEYENKSEGEWSFKDYLLSMSSETIFKRPQYFEFIDGEMLFGMVESEEDYKKIFKSLEKLSKDKSELCKDIISKFYSECEKKGYSFDSAFKDDLSLHEIMSLNQNECFKSLNIDWAKLYADQVHNDADFEKVEKIVSSELANQFRKYCSENGICIAKMSPCPKIEVSKSGRSDESNRVVKRRLDPWDELANSKDYEIIARALEDTDDVYWSDSSAVWDGYKSKYEYNSISVLGRQIIEVMFLSKCPKEWLQLFKFRFSDSYIKDLKSVVDVCVDVCDNHATIGNGGFLLKDSDYLCMIDHVPNGNKFNRVLEKYFKKEVRNVTVSKSSTFTDYNYICGMSIAQLVAELLKEKLNKYRS